MLSVEINNLDNGEIEIYANRQGVESLAAQLQFLLSDKTDHVHLMSEDWGGSHLTDRPYSEAHVSVKHLKIYLRSDDDWAERTGERG